MSLYVAESRRLVKRRFTRYFVLGLLIALIAIAAAMFFSNQKIGPAQIEQAKAAAHAQFVEATQQATEQKQTCVAGHGKDCDQYTVPTEDNFDYSWNLPPTFDFHKKFPDLITALSALLAVTGFVLGATFVGAEWSSGGMANLLLWRPQRLRVLTTKLSAFLVAMAALTVVLTAAWTGLFALIAKLRGTTDGMTSGVWQSMLLMELRGLVLVLVAAALGFGLASLGRRTATALGVAIGLIMVFQFGLRTALALAKVKFADAYLIPIWAIGWMKKEDVIYDYDSCNFNAAQGCEPDTFTITWHMAGIAMAVAFVAIVGAALWSIRTRDVT